MSEDHAEQDATQDPGAPTPAGTAPAPPSEDSGDGTAPEPVEGSQGVIGDDQLPEDLRPTEDNPLAQPLPDGETADIELPQPDPEPDPETDSEPGPESESDSESGSDTD